MHGISPWRLIGVMAAMAIWFGSAYVTMNFVTAETPEQAELRGERMPAGWSAGVWNHGRYLRWYRIQDNPWLFAAGLLGFPAGFGLASLVIRFTKSSPLEEEFLAMALREQARRAGNPETGI